MKIRIGTRESKLAVAQTNLVVDSIKEMNKEIEIEIITMKTIGDKILDKSLDKIGGKGLFVKELDEALLDKRIDIAVHSYKDMPMEINDSLEIVAVSKREDAKDVLILPIGVEEIDKTKPIGCSSLRRKLQFSNMYPELEIKPIRGNVLTRIEKLDRGEFSAIILAYAGIKRLGLENRVSRIFTVQEILPAACQGMIAIEGRKGFEYKYLECFNNKDSHDISVAERSFIKYLNGGCSEPFAAYGEVENNVIKLTGLYVKSGVSHIKTIFGDRKNGYELGIDLAKQMRGCELIE